MNDAHNPPNSERHKHLATGSVRVAPSLMCADLMNFERDFRRLEALGVELFHYDMMDAHFVPNMPTGLALLDNFVPGRTCLLTST